jgi:hypothetical protein
MCKTHFAVGVGEIYNFTCHYCCLKVVLFVIICFITFVNAKLWLFFTSVKVFS